MDTSAAQTFTITVSAVDDAPVFALGSDQTVNEDAGPQTVAGFASGMAPGPAAATDEAGQALSPFGVSVIGTTGTLAFTSAPAIDLATGTLTYQPAANTNGAATVSSSTRSQPTCSPARMANSTKPVPGNSTEFITT